MTTTDPSATGRAPHTAGNALVDRQWLHTHLNDPLVRVVEVDVSPAAYSEGHIESATLWNTYADLKDADYRTVDASAFQRLITRSGIDPDCTVVFYGYAAAFGFWLTKLYGHRDTRILDCSRETWRAEGRPWTSAVNPLPPGTFRLQGEDAGIRANEATVRHAVDRPVTTVLDVRSGREYRGECFWPSGGMEPGGRAGHVPSAVHQPLDDLYNPDGSFRVAAELRGVFSPAVLDGDEELITYCTIGGRAATAWFVLSYLLGRDRVRVYDGSWAEWGRTPGAAAAV